VRRQPDTLIRWNVRHAACNVFAGLCGAQPASRAPGSAVPTPDRVGFARCPSPTRCSLSLRSGCGVSLRGCAAQGSPPIPLAGGFRRPSNITRDYAHMSYVSGAGSGVQPSLDPRPHNQRYVKWPRSPAGWCCVLRTTGPGVFARLSRLSPSPISSPTRPGVSLRAAAAATRPSLPPAAPFCLQPPSEKSVLAWHVGA